MTCVGEAIPSAATTWLRKTVRDKLDAFRKAFVEAECDVSIQKIRCGHEYVYPEGVPEFPDARVPRDVRHMYFDVALQDCYQSFYDAMSSIVCNSDAALAYLASGRLSLTCASVFVARSHYYWDDIIHDVLKVVDALGETCVRKHELCVLFECDENGSRLCAYIDECVHPHVLGSSRVVTQDASKSQTRAVLYERASNVVRFTKATAHLTGDDCVLHVADSCVVRCDVHTCERITLSLEGNTNYRSICGLAFFRDKGRYDDSAVAFFIDLYSYDVVIPPRRVQFEWHTYDLIDALLRHMFVYFMFPGANEGVRVERLPAHGDALVMETCAVPTIAIFDSRRVYRLFNWAEESELFVMLSPSFSAYVVQNAFNCSREECLAERKNYALPRAFRIGPHPLNLAKMVTRGGTSEASHDGAVASLSSSTDAQSTNNSKGRICVEHSPHSLTVFFASDYPDAKKYVGPWTLYPFELDADDRGMQFVREWLDSCQRDSFCRCSGERIASMCRAVGIDRLEVLSHSFDDRKCTVGDASNLHLALGGVLCSNDHNVVNQREVLRRKLMERISRGSRTANGSNQRVWTPMRMRVTSRHFVVIDDSSERARRMPTHYRVMIDKVEFPDVTVKSGVCCFFVCESNIWVENFSFCLASYDPVSGCVFPKKSPRSILTSAKEAREYGIHDLTRTLSDGPTASGVSFVLHPSFGERFSNTNDAICFGYHVDREFFAHGTISLNAADHNENVRLLASRLRVTIADSEYHSTSGSPLPKSSPKEAPLGNDDDKSEQPSTTASSSASAPSSSVVDDCENGYSSAKQRRRRKQRRRQQSSSKDAKTPAPPTKDVFYSEVSQVMCTYNFVILFVPAVMVDGHGAINGLFRHRTPLSPPEAPKEWSAKVLRVNANFGACYSLSDAITIEDDNCVCRADQYLATERCGFVRVATALYKDSVVSAQDFDNWPTLCLKTDSRRVTIDVPAAVSDYDGELHWSKALFMRQASDQRPQEVSREHETTSPIEIIEKTKGTRLCVLSVT